MRLFGAGRGVLAGVLLTALTLPGAAAPVGAQALTWSFTRSPNIDSGDGLGGVSCVSATACVAVGSFTNTSGVGKTLIESWDGTRWATVPSPSPEPGENSLGSVSCVSVTFCMAVGEDSVISPAEGDYQSLAEMWNGTRWSVLPTPSTRFNDELSGVSCVTPAACVAVGQILGGFSRPLVESWNGTGWSVLPSPHIPAGLTGVSCVSAAWCVAVGAGTPSSKPAGLMDLIEHWNGTTWSKVPNPAEGSASNVLDAVSCASAITCMAVGHYESGAPWSTLVKSWNGTHWSVLPSPNTSSSDQLLGVSCDSAAACMAVGYSGDASGVATTLIESWDGTHWSIVPSPSPAPLRNGLGGVSCASPAACTATGSYRRVGRTLIESTTASQ